MNLGKTRSIESEILRQTTSRAVRSRDFGIIQRLLPFLRSSLPLVAGGSVRFSSVKFL